MLEYRAGGILSSSGTPGRLAGYAAIFGSESSDLGGFREIVKPGAFTKSLSSGRNIRCLWQHDSSVLLGTTNAKTLRLQEDRKGLAFEVDLPDTSAGRDLSVLVSRGDVAGCSFGFVVKDDKWERRADGWLRELAEVALREVTLTPDPAYADTTVALRSLSAHQQFGGLGRLWLETVR